ncbi:MAG: histidine triad nucleotide-binding protein [Ruminococcus sp.]|nr:histidine triad nucleotide-binding protein [Ruminococcus sp.]
MDCLFCKIIAGEIPSTKVYEDDKVYAFNDINPAAPVHILIIPKVHIASAAEVTAENADIVGHIFEVAAKLAKEKGLDNGYRIVTNCGDDAGQSVHHLHFHLIGGRFLGLKMVED